MKKSELQELEIEGEALKWFEARGIEFDVLTYAGIYTSETFMRNGHYVTFPRYSLNGEVVNNRMGTLIDGELMDICSNEEGQDCFYNAQGLDLAISEEQPLVICQREMDTLSLMQATHAWTIAYVDGDDLLWNNRDKFKKVKKIILCGFNNDQGKHFNESISKQLGIENCKFVVYPDDCMTVNDVLVKHGKDSVLDLIKESKDYPVVGLYRPNEFPPIPEDLKKVHETNLGQEHNHRIKIMLGKFMVVTGIPGHGKSEWADGLVMDLAKKHNWKVCVCSTEIDNEEYQENSIHRYLRRPLDNVGPNEPAKALEFYQNHYTFITNNTMDNEIELSLEKLIELAKIAIVRDGCKVLLLDPWNEIEHCRGKNETETEYTGRAIRMLKRLAKQFKVLVIVVAHPSKPPTGRQECPNLYSINGSANWANKADYGIIIWRENKESDLSEVRIAKIKRHGPMGYEGAIAVKLNVEAKRFEEC